MTFLLFPGVHLLPQHGRRLARPRGLRLLPGGPPRPLRHGVRPGSRVRLLRLRLRLRRLLRGGRRRLDLRRAARQRSRHAVCREM